LAVILPFPVTIAVSVACVYSFFELAVVKSIPFELCAVIFPEADLPISSFGGHIVTSDSVVVPVA